MVNRNAEYLPSAAWWQRVRRLIGSVPADFPFMQKVELARTIQPVIDITTYAAEGTTLQRTTWEAVTLSAGQNDAIRGRLDRVSLQVVNLSDEEILWLPTILGLTPAAGLGIKTVPNGGQLTVNLTEDGAFATSAWTAWVSGTADVQVALGELV